ncbi:type I restriction-modification system subunit M [Limosilactobacillus mucosae]|uniref:site-specific DNA-methyltransferase (adenine-specific) n=1 Tax=Limosilactobacillus mucosae TaxID=97478 RepID=A0AAJ1HRF7_LIMMU|nr:type I restriction-modification system subunit M [Limosilactobacillus mucosae]MDC2829177.1 type I restriction-modification system subunit M [Limosilactobacillus mucosae]MDC2836537.1 type I restriction-modification system subunit M [Limosilactobacillus mucosae]MDC2848696.1 type I restriction-modification system subunit M [Limosilactobacillus mucosae]MDC2853271.1 type I restriction-modification system subunit M [Limosilactobacillus mucosae]
MSKAQDVSSQLWSMANELRGTMDASEYRNYILGFMFYRYLSEKQEKYLIDNDIFDQVEGKSINDLYRQDAVGDDLKDYLEDISGALGYAIAPEDTWTTLMEKIHDSKANAEDFQNIFDHFEENAQLNSFAEKDFRGVFADVNLNNSRLGNNLATRTKALIATAKMVNDFDYFDENGHDILGDVYEYLIKQFASNAGKKAGEFYTPHEVSKVLAKLVAANMDLNQESFSIYDPTMGSGSLLLTVRDELPNGRQKGRVRFYGQELNTTTYNLARMNLMMHGVDYGNMTLRNADTLAMDWPDGLDQDGVDRPHFFDAVVANPPYSQKWDADSSKLKDPRFKDYGALAPKGKADYAFLLHSLYHLEQNGTMAIVLPHGVLFRGAAEGKIRKALLEKGQIDAIIGMPAGLFYSTGIPTIVMVLKKHRDNRDVLFIDASKGFEKGKNQNILRDQDIDKIIETYKKRQDVDKYAHLATMDEIKENEFNLNIPRYVDTFEEEPPIDIVALSKEMQDIDQKIAQSEAEFLSLVDDLDVNEHTQSTINAIKAVFKHD